MGVSDYSATADYGIHTCIKYKGFRIHVVSHISHMLDIEWVRVLCVDSILDLT